MGVINVLSFEVANLIAAGEVVDRPSSAIKEMMENSIDAGANRITVEIKNGGVVLMRVTDNGCGMEASDLPMAIKRHATSKISSASDLDGISTLGFRGEALAAISAVSDMRIISKKKDAPIGAMLESHPGEGVALYEQPSSDGTTVIVENLFASVPARRKFLKRDVTESMAVSANVERVALSHPEIAVRLICDGQLKIETAGDGKLLSTIYAIYGRDFASKIIEVNGEYDGIRISGYIGRPDNVKANRNFQNFFINKRFVKSKTMSAAVEQAFVSFLQPEKFPACVLFADLNPGKVDVNVHPAKLEVKFSNEKPVFEAVYYAVKEALQKDCTRPELPTQKKTMNVSAAFAPVENTRPEPLSKRQVTIDTVSQVPQKQNEASSFQTTQKPEQERLTASEYLAKYANTEKDKANTAPAVTKPVSVKQDDKRTVLSSKPIPDTEAVTVTPQKETTNTTSAPSVLPQNASNVPPVVQTETPKVDTVEEKKVNYRIIGEAYNCYIVVEVGDKLLLIDKHAAHERLIFEKLKANMRKSLDSGVPDSQMLMIPLEVMLTGEEIETLKLYRSELEAVGFGFDTARNTVYVNMLPVGVDASDASDMLAVMAGRLISGTGDIKKTRDEIFEKALYQASCKAAIKGGRVYPPEFAAHLVDKLMELPDITYCPHGRPIAMEITKSTLDRRFERT